MIPAVLNVLKYKEIAVGIKIKKPFDIKGPHNKKLLCSNQLFLA